MAVNFCQLGKLYFTSTVLDYNATQSTLMPAPTATSTERGVYLVEHALINRPGLLQATGRKLKTRTLNITLRQNFCNVRDAIDYFSLMMYSYIPQPLIWGNGVIDGLYMIENISETDNEFFEDGALIACDLVINLKEYVDASPLKRVQQENRDKAVAVGDKKSNVMRGRSNKPTCLQDVSRYMQQIKMHVSRVNTEANKYNVLKKQDNIMKQSLNVIKLNVQNIRAINLTQGSCLYKSTLIDIDGDNLYRRCDQFIAILNANQSAEQAAIEVKNATIALNTAAGYFDKTMAPYINKTISRG